MNYLKDAIDFTCANGHVKKYLAARNNNKFHPIGINARYVNTKKGKHTVSVQVTFDYFVMNGDNSNYYEDFFVWIGWNKSTKSYYVIYIGKVQELEEAFVTD